MKAVSNPQSETNATLRELMNSNANSWVTIAVLSNKLAEREDQVNIYQNALQYLYSILTADGRDFFLTKEQILERAKAEYDKTI